MYIITPKVNIISTTILEILDLAPKEFSSLAWGRHRPWVKRLFRHLNFSKTLKAPIFHSWYSTHFMVWWLKGSRLACLSPSFLSYIAVLLYTTFKFNFLFLKVIFQERKTTQCSLFEWTKESKFIFAKFRILMSNKCTYILTLGWCM